MKKKRRAFHIGVLLIGIYLLFLGGGTLIGEIGALVILGSGRPSSSSGSSWGWRSPD